jgi:hypothetical protein
MKAEYFQRGARAQMDELLRLAGEVKALKTELGFDAAEKKH